MKSLLFKKIILLLCISISLHANGGTSAFNTARIVGEVQLTKTDSIALIKEELDIQLFSKKN